MKPIKGYEHYLISKCGTKVFNTKTNKYLFISNREKTTDNTYKVVTLKIGNIYKKFYIHRLVADTYIENEYNLPIINHKDGDKSNNHYLNLEWCTYSHNLSHAYKLGAKIFTEKQRNGLNKVHENEITYIKVINTLTGEIFKSITEASKSINTHKTVLARKLRGKTKNNTSMQYYKPLTK